MPNSRAPAHLTIHEEHVPEPAHEGVRCLLAPKWDELPVVADEEIVENECFHMIRCREVVTARRPHHQIPIEAEVLLDVLADVGVVPVDPRIREVQVVREGATGSHGPLREVRYAIESVVEPNPVPMNRGWLIERIDELDDDRRALRDADQRPGVLSVEAIHREAVAVQQARHRYSS